jgi:hypothetical protein
VGSSPGRAKSKTVKLVFVVCSLRCFSEQALFKIIGG